MANVCERQKSLSIIMLVCRKLSRQKIKKEKEKEDTG